MPHWPSIAISSDASTADCKRLLDQVDKAAHPGGAPKGDWKRLSKRGSAPRVERVFQNGSGLFALVSQTPGLLSVERLAQDAESLLAQPAKALAPEEIHVEARSTASAKAQLCLALGLSGKTATTKTTTIARTSVIIL